MGSPAPNPNKPESNWHVHLQEEVISSTIHGKIFTILETSFVDGVMCFTAVLLC